RPPGRPRPEASSGTARSPAQAATPSETSPAQSGTVVSPVTPAQSGAGPTPSDRLPEPVVLIGSEVDVDRLGRLVDGRRDAELLQDPLLQLVGQVGVVAQEVAGVLLALAELVTFV